MGEEGLEPSTQQGYRFYSALLVCSTPELFSHVLFLSSLNLKQGATNAFEGFASRVKIILTVHDKGFEPLDLPKEF